jgi:hypothetical protein
MMANRPKKKRAALGTNPLSHDPLEAAGIGGTEKPTKAPKRTAGKPAIMATSFRLADDVVGYLKGAAFTTGRTAADIVESALREYLPKIEKEAGAKFPRPQ